jgi:hypothetical protein
VVLFLAYTLAGFFLVPRLVRTYVPRYVAEQLGRRAEIGEVRVNPLLFRMDIRHFRLTEPDGRPLLGFDRLFVDFELTSIVRAAWTFAEIRLEAPRVDAVIEPDGRLNIAELLDSVPKAEAKAEPGPPPRLLLQHAVMRDGVVSFTDRSGRTPQTATLQPINLELRDVTTLRERRGPYTITATLTGGGVLGWDGYVSLVPLASTGRVDLRGFPLATAWRFVQDTVAVAEPAGTLDANVRYQFGYRDGTTALKVEGVEVAVTGLAVTERGGKAPILTLDKVDLVAAWGDVIARELTVPEISVSRGRVAASLARDGTVNWQRLLTAPASAPAEGAAPAAPATATAEPRPWRVAVEKLRVDDVALAVVDESRAAPLALDVGAVNVGLSAKLESGASGLAGVVDGLGVTLARVAVREGPSARTALVALDRIALEGGRVDLGARQVSATRLGVDGGATTVVREADGALPMLKALAPAEPPKPVRAAPAAKRPAGTPAAKPWTVALGKLELGGHRVAVTDRGVTPAVELGLADLKASVRDVRTDGKKPWPFDASFRVVQGGRFSARGTVAPDGRAADARLTLTQLAMTAAQPYVARTAAVVLKSGDVSTGGRLTYRAGRDRPAVTYTGSVDVDRVAVLEAATNEPLLGWTSLHAETVRFGLGPDRLEIDEVRLAGLDGRVIIFEDKSLNLARLMKPTAAPPPPPAVPPPSALPATAAGREATEMFPVTVGRVRLDQSAMHFADLSLVLPFATRVHELSGVVVGLGSAPDSRASVKLEGKVDEFGLMQVDGALAAFQPKVFTDLAVIFRNVPMSTLSPYSATFAGRRIEAGTLNLDLQYKIDHSELVGDNKVVLQRLKLGERVESPGAMRLPLDLAIAILSDAEGRIDIALPVRGNVDRPEFSYGHLIWQALVTVITKVATAPFRALGSLFGGDGEKLEAIAFEPGRDVVAPPEREKLKRVGEVLAKRPQLKVTAHGTYDPKVDGEALRAAHVRRELAQRLGVAVKPGEDPGPVAFDDVKTQRALEALLTQRAGDKAVGELVAGWEKSSGKKAERANPVLALVGRGAGDRALYEAIYRRLVETAPLAETELTGLAQRRGEAIVRVLGEGAAARAAAGAPEPARGAERRSVPSRLELGAVGS